MIKSCSALITIFGCGPRGSLSGRTVVQQADRRFWVLSLALQHRHFRLQQNNILLLEQEFSNIHPHCNHLQSMQKICSWVSLQFLVVLRKCGCCQSGSFRGHERCLACYRPQTLYVSVRSELIKPGAESQLCSNGQQGFSLGWQSNNLQCGDFHL